MGIRDKIAIAAMKSLIRKLPMQGTALGIGEQRSLEEIEKIHQGIACGAYKYADAMLKARGDVA